MKCDRKVGGGWWVVGWFILFFGIVSIIVVFRVLVIVLFDVFGGWIDVLCGFLFVVMLGGL